LLTHPEVDLTYCF